MPTYTKNLLSGSSFGASIMLSTTASPGTLIHSTEIGATATDEVWLYANNVSGIDATVTVFWGTTATNNNLGPMTVQGYAGPVLISPGLILQGSGSTAANIYALPSSTSGINIVGYVNRITS